MVRVRAGAEVASFPSGLKGGTEGWSLEVVDSQDGSTVWGDLFATDQDARDEFYRTLDAEGIRSFFVDHPSKSLH